MAYNGPKPTSRQQADARLSKSEKHDAQFFVERKAREAANIAKTMELRKLRLAKETREREAAAAAAAAAPPKTKRKSVRAAPKPDTGSNEGA